MLCLSSVVSIGYGATTLSYINRDIPWFLRSDFIPRSCLSFRLGSIFVEWIVLGVTSMIVTVCLCSKNVLLWTWSLYGKSRVLMIVVVLLECEKRILPCCYREAFLKVQTVFEKELLDSFASTPAKMKIIKKKSGRGAQCSEPQIFLTRKNDSFIDNISFSDSRSQHVKKSHGRTYWAR